MAEFQLLAEKFNVSPMIAVATINEELDSKQRVRRQIAKIANGNALSRESIERIPRPKEYSSEKPTMKLKHSAQDSKEDLVGKASVRSKQEASILTTSVTKHPYTQNPDRTPVIISATV